MDRLCTIEADFEGGCSSAFLGVRQSFGLRDVGHLGPLCGAFSFRKLPDFLVIACRRDLSDIAPFDFGACAGPRKKTIQLRPRPEIAGTDYGVTLPLKAGSAWTAPQRPFFPASLDLR